MTEQPRQSIVVQKKRGCCGGLLAIIGAGTVGLIALGVIISINQGKAPHGKAMDMAMYEKIRTGMSYSEVVIIIGFEGAEQGQSQINGVPGVMESITTTSYEWRNGMSAISAMFQNDKLVQKNQFMLK